MTESPSAASRRRQSNDGEIAVASNEELHAARLSAKRLLALWNALPGVPKRRKVGDRDALIDQLWSAIEMPGSTHAPARWARQFRWAKAITCLAGVADAGRSKPSNLP